MERSTTRTAKTMKETPILFSTTMVQSILAGLKTQTRRIIKDDWFRCLDPESEEDKPTILAQCPYGKAGDRLYVKESFYAYGQWERTFFNSKRSWKFNDCTKNVGKDWLYVATDPEPELVDQRGNIGWHKRPSLFMTREASRILLDITDIKFERLNDLSDADGYREGIPIERMCPEIDLPEYLLKNGELTYSVQMAFEERWDALNGKVHPWKSNPWVWVISFPHYRQK